jgi:DNA-directed RNA polymerase specialized sigma24 family protein
MAMTARPRTPAPAPAGQNPGLNLHRVTRIRRVPSQGATPPLVADSSATPAFNKAPAQDSSIRAPIEPKRRSEPAVPAQSVQIDWCLEAVARRLEVRRFLLTQGARVEAVDDHEQEVIERLLRLGTQPRRAHPRTVIWVVCYNVLAAYWRRERARRLVDPQIAESLLASIAGPDDRLNRSAAWSECCCLIAPLPKVPRCVVYMREIMELTNAETALLLDTTQAATRVAYSRAMAELTARRRREEQRDRRR